MVILACPVFNCDGNDMISRKNRPWQNGPEEGVGARYNGQGLDINRDGIKAETCEFRALLEKVIKPWDPDVFVDCHTTDGCLHEHPLLVEGPLPIGMDPELRKYVRRELISSIMKRVGREFGYDFNWYGYFKDRADPSKGWVTFLPLPRYLTNYVGIRGRIGILSEAYVYKDFKTRIYATLALLEAVLKEVDERRREILCICNGCDLRAERLHADCACFPLDYRPLPEKWSITVRGRKQRRQGNEWVPEGGTVKWKIPFYSNFVYSRSVNVPEAWLLPRDCGEVMKLLRVHGVVTKRTERKTKAKVEIFWVSGIERSRRPFQGHRLVKLKGNYERALMEIPAGLFFVPSNTPLSWLSLWLLEPESPDGLATWGFFRKWTRKGCPYPVIRILSWLDS